MDVLMTIIGAMVFLAYFRLCRKQKAPIKAMALNSGFGLIFLILMAMVTGALGNGLYISYTSVSTAVSLGIPGVIMLLLITYII